MTETKINDRIKRTFGKDLSIYLSVDPGFVSLVTGLVEACLQEQRRDYEEVLEDKRRLTRELDIEMNGLEGAAPQAALCDLVGDHTKVVRKQRREILARCVEFLNGKGARYLANELRRTVSP